MNNEEAWAFAIGIVQCEGKRVSDDFLALVEREKRGEITTEDIQRYLEAKYKQEDKT